jgi:hypothetical protein
MVLLTPKQSLEMDRIKRFPGESLDSYIQETINYWILSIDYQVNFRNFFLEEILLYIKSFPENEVNLEPLYRFENFSQWVFMKSVFKDNSQRIELIQKEIYNKFDKHFVNPINFKRFDRITQVRLYNDYVLNLSNLKLTDKILKKYIPRISEQLSKTYPIPKSLILFYKETSKLSKSKIIAKSYVENEILLNNNKLTNIPIFEPYTEDMKKYSKLTIDLEGNNIPVEYFLESEEFYGKRIVFRFQGNEGFPFKKFDSIQFSEYKASNGKLYKVYTIPKGTLLFRQYHSMKDIYYSFTGYPASEDNNYPKDKYYLVKDHRSYFTLEPRFKDGNYGDVDIVMILQQDVKLIIGWFGEDAYSKEECPENPPTKIGAGTCMVQEFRDNGFSGWIAEPFSSEKGGPTVSLWMIPYLQYMPHLTSQVMIHPTKNNEDIVIDISSVDTPEKMEKYLKENMERFNYKPLKIFDEKSTKEEYLKFIKELLSKKGWKDDDEKVYKAIRNPIDGTYILK